MKPNWIAAALAGAACCAALFLAVDTLRAQGPGANPANPPAANPPAANPPGANRPATNPPTNPRAATPPNSTTPAPPATGRVATLDVVKVFNEFQRQKDLSEEMKQLQDKLQAENTTRRNKLDEEEASLSKISQDDPTYVARTRELLAKQIEYKNWSDLKQADVTREIALWSCRIYTEIAKAAGDVAQEQGYDIVLYKDEFECNTTNPDQIREQIRSRKVIYGSPSVDISQLVLDKLNSDYRAKPRAPMMFVP